MGLKLRHFFVWDVFCLSNLSTDVGILNSENGYSNALPVVARRTSRVEHRGLRVASKLAQLLVNRWTR